MIHISYKNIDGYMNLDTDEVYFYHFKYKNILEAIKRLENDIENYKEKIKITDNLINNLICFQST